MTGSEVVDGATVLVLGAAVGVGELVSRYRDAPLKALKRPAAAAYVLLNALAAVGAYALIRAFDWHLGTTDPTTTRWTRVLVAGFGAMALFRSSLFVVRIANQDVGVGPSSLLGVLLNVADRAVDRDRGQARAREVARLLMNVSWEQARADLPALCLGLMQNASLLEKEALAGAIRDLEAGDLDDDVRVHLVGLELLNLAGVGVLRGAVDLLQRENRN